MARLPWLSIGAPARQSSPETNLSSGRPHRSPFHPSRCAKQMRTHTKWNCEEVRVAVVTLVNVIVSLALSVITVFAPD